MYVYKTSSKSVVNAKMHTEKKSRATALNCNTIGSKSKSDAILDIGDSTDLLISNNYYPLNQNDPSYTLIFTTLSIQYQ